MGFKELFREEDLGGAEAGEFIEKLSFVFQFIDAKIGSGEIEDGKAETGVDLRQRGQEIVGFVVQKGRGDEGSGSESAHNGSFDKAFGRFRIFELLGNRHLVSLGDEPVDIGLAGVERNPAHRNLLPFRQCEIDLPGNELSIFMEGFVEVSQSEKKERVFCPLFTGAPLRHQRSFCHDLTYSLFDLFFPQTNEKSFFPNEGDSL